jgi:FkbM family methyltransferase
LDQATITAAGRSLVLTGHHPSYLRLIHASDADRGLAAGVIADLATGSVILDVGANIGATALPMAVQRPDCRVLAFEAVPSNAECLRQNIQANGITNVEVIEKAVSDAPGIITMNDNGPWSHAAAGGAIRCETITLDDYASLAPPFIKMDVEGYEPNVMAGAPRLLSMRPLLLIEVNAWALLLHHYDPLTYANAIWDGCEILAITPNTQDGALPATGEAFAHLNITEHHCVSDLLLRPHGAMAGLAAMTSSPECQQLRADLTAMHASRSWRSTAVLRGLKRVFG